MLDAIIITFSVVALVIGIRKGIVKQLGAIGALIAGVALCRVAGPWCAMRVAAATRELSAEVTITDTVVGYLLMFAVGYLAARLVAHFLRDLTHAMSLGFFDRLAGGLFTVTEWLFILSLLLNLWLVIQPEANLHGLSKFGNGALIDFAVSFAPKLLGMALH